MRLLLINYSSMVFAVFLASSRRSAVVVSAFTPTRAPTRTTALGVSFLDDIQSNLQKTFSSMTSPDSSSSSPYFTVAITGASGMLGNAVIDELSKKQGGMLKGKQLKIVKLQRSDNIEEGLALDNDATSAESSESNINITTLNWNPNAIGADSINKQALESIDTVVHLAGENVGAGLLPGPLGWLGVQAWSKEKKNLILDSRTGPTKALATAIAECTKPTTYIVASGVGVYGSDFFADENDKIAPDESADISNTKGFLAEVSRQWEFASLPAIREGALLKNRVVNLRLAPIMSKKGGALGKLYPIFFLGGGGIVGSGNQYFSYISARDAARSIVHIIENDSLKGPVNLVAPTPATNSDFTSAFGKVISRPTIVPLPGFAVKLLFGEMGEEMLLGGVKAAPKKLLDSGFEFQHETIEKALESAVNENI
jgi:uncharacterized protein (TIGR01777 family)